MSRKSEAQFIQNGKLSVGRVTTNVQRPDGRYDYISISLDCGTSSSRVVEIEMSTEEFAACLMGQGWSDCQFRWWPGAPVGKFVETKRVEVSIPWFGPIEGTRSLLREKAVRAAIEVHEVDGWMGDDKDASNHHCFVSGAEDRGFDIYRVRFHRYVDSPPKPVLPKFSGKPDRVRRKPPKKDVPYG